MKRHPYLVTLLLAGLAGGCSAAPDGPAAAGSSDDPARPARAESAPASIPGNLLGNLPVPQEPCPSTWCGVSNDCVSWTCMQPIFHTRNSTYTCTPSYAPAGTFCSDSSTCVGEGACNGQEVCNPWPGHRDVCETTTLGAADGYVCGACIDYACSAERGGGLEYPVSSTFCTLVAQ